MSKASVNKDACIGCGVCEASCPMGAIKLVDGKAAVDADKCTGCGACVGSCPVTAIKN
ncbi:MAG: 4Fe-4S binding protein [Mycoplasmataceae bacterium]|jgi:ferredoxin|nr:4Fe-4S binding protein [Mycoplasmataceae bacterium]